MNQALQIGPLSLPYSVLLTLVAIALGGFVAKRLARAAGTEAEPTLTHMLLVGLVAARLAFVWQYRIRCDAWLIWNIWQVANPDLAQVVELDEPFRIYRDAGVGRWLAHLGRSRAVMSARFRHHGQEQ